MHLKSPRKISSLKKWNSFINGVREREGERVGDQNTETETEIDRQRDRGIITERQRHYHREIDTDRQRYIIIFKQLNPNNIFYHVSIKI